MLKHPVTSYQFQHKLRKQPRSEHFRDLRMCYGAAALAAARPHPRRLRRVNPQGWRQRGAGGLDRMNQLIAGGLLKSGVIDFLPHP